MKNIKEEIKKKTEQLNTRVNEIDRLQEILKSKQVSALRLQGAISALKELNEPENKEK